MDHDAFTGKYLGPVGPLVLSGDIVPGDYERLLAKIAEAPDRYLSQNKLIVASTAGDAAEAIRIAALLKSLYADVQVGPQTGRCAGPCFLLFAAAAQRSADGDGLVGVEVPVQGAARAFLAANEIPAYLLDEPPPRAAREVYWLNPQDLAKLGSKSPAFTRFLTGKCAWDDELERAATTGHGPFEVLKPMWACRVGAVQAEARKALAAALKPSAPALKDSAPR